MAAAKEFNIGKETLVDFLKGKGFDIDATKPTAKLTEEMYASLQDEFAQDKAAKRKSDSIALPKGLSIDSLNKSQEQLDLSAKDKKEEKSDYKKFNPVVEEPSPAPPKKSEEPAVQPEPVPVPSVPEVKEEPAPAKEDIPVVEDKPAAPPQETIAPPEKEQAQSTDEDGGPEHIELQSPKLEGPKVLNKINLDDLNMSTRPKKGAPKKKDGATEESSSSAEPLNEDVTGKVEESPVQPAVETPPAPVVANDAPPEPENIPTPKVIVKEEEKSKPDEEVREHIEVKAPKLEGPKIIGKIELPVNSTGGKQERKDKRKRKRIPLENKKPESNRPNQPSQGQGVAGNRPHRPQSGGTGYSGPGRGAQGGQQSGHGGYQAGRNRNDFRNNRNAGKPGAARTGNVEQEIDAKAIQEKIRETQAKLAGGGSRNKNLKAKYRRNKREEMAEKRAAAEQASDSNVIQVTEFISVSELANLLDVSFADIIGKCMSLGIMVSINQRLDAEVIELVASEFDHEVEFINLEEGTDEDETIQDDENDLEPRAPIVTIMGHVDHGKTSLLDYIRNASVVAGEAGGITQHIGAYKVTTESGKSIAFLDTPGHEAFTAMRARGAKVADVAVIVIAADDAIMPQTREAIVHAQAANLPMIFAINKMDKEAANPEKIKEQLANMNILVEDWGGKFQSQEISAKKGLNIDLLLEKILLEAEMLELKANPNREGSGSTIEASLDKGRGYVSTVLVQTGTLRTGDMIVSGQYFGKVKAMFNERGQKISIAGPSTPVQVLGLNGAPQAGEKFKVFTDETEAKNIANHRAQIMREQGLRSRKHITLDEIGRRLALGNFKELNVIIKADFDGSAEALSDSLQKLSTEEVVVNVILKGVGQITESDVMLASASDAIMLGFQVRPSPQAAKLAEQENIEIRYYSIIYDAIAEIKSAMEGMLEPTLEKKVVGNIEVREVYKISGVGSVAGCYVLDGKFTRNTKINLIRDGIVVHTGELASLKRFKDDVKEVNAGYECGLMLKNYNDVNIGDILEGYEEVEVKRKLG